MNNEKFIASSMNELTYAESSLNIIADNDIKADGSLFNVLEGVVENIERAKKSVCSINIDNKTTSIGSFVVIGGESLETILGTVTNTLKTAENLTVAADSGKIKFADTNIVNLIQSVRLVLETVYEKVSFSEC